MSRSPFQINLFSDWRPFCQQAGSFGPMTKLLLILMIVGWVVGVFNGCGHLIKTHTEKYDNGKVSGEGNYIDGKEEGSFVFYYESGKVKGEGHYVVGEKEGKVIAYYESGEIVDEDIYRDGKCVEDCEGNDP